MEPITNEDSKALITANAKAAEIEQPINKLEDMEPTKISLNAFIGQISCSSLRLTGNIYDKPILIIIDNGSIHNFLSIAIVKELGIPVDSLEAFVMQIGNGDIIYCKSICRQVIVKLKNINIKEDFYPFELENVELF